MNNRDRHKKIDKMIQEWQKEYLKNIDKKFGWFGFGAIRYSIITIPIVLSWILQAICKGSMLPPSSEEEDKNENT